MDPLLAIGQIMVSIALIIAILLQARGVGLSGTFGGDSAVYRSRRGVERRLWQFTIVLLVLFVIFSLAAFIFAPAATGLTGGTAAAHRDQHVRSELDDPHRLARRRDARRAVRDHRGPRRCPLAQPRRLDHRRAEPSRPSTPSTRPYREGVLGHPISVSPFSARTQADRDLVSLVFSGLVRNGPSGTLVPDLAERWTVDPSGVVWTFQLRDDAAGTTASR